MAPTPATPYIDAMDEDEAARPRPPAYPGITRAERAHGRRLADIHDMYRAELDAVAVLLDRIRAHEADPAMLAPAVGGMRLAQNMAAFGISGKGALALFSSHPPIESRIAALQAE